MANAPRLLIVSAFFPPSRKIGARRPERFARHLGERGWDVTVLTLRASHAYPADGAWNPPPGVRVIRTRAFVPGNALREAATAMRRLIARGEAPSTGAGGGDDVPEPTGAPRAARPVRDAVWRAVSRAEFPDRWIGWKPFALAATRGLRFDAVLATLPPYSSALIAQRIALRTSAILALDYRDPWTEAPRAGWDPALYAHLLDRHRSLEDACLRGADVVLATSRTIARWLAPRAGIETLFAPNSFDARDSGPAARTASRTLVYAGSLAYGRSLEPVLAAMAKLSNDPSGREVELVYAGSDGAQVLRQAARLGLKDRVRSVGFVSARASDALVRDALAAVVLVTPRYEYMLPGKLFEVVAAGAPLLLVAPADSDVAAMCREHRLGWQHVPGDVDGIAASIRSALKGEVPVPTDLEALRTDHVVDLVDRELRAAVVRGPRAVRTPHRA